jgi:hypothetical protein
MLRASLHRLLLPAVFVLLVRATPGLAQTAAGAGTHSVVPGAAESGTNLQYDAENQLVHQGIARRNPGEADTAFLHRLFPQSFFAETLVVYAWRPSTFGKQLLFSRREIDEYQREGEGTDLFVLDPFQPATYAVQKLPLAAIGDITNLAALFFADVDGDGPKELLALVYAEVQEVGTLEHDNGTSEKAYGRMTHWHTYVFRYAGRSPGPAGRPRYRADTTPRPYLHGLPTAAAVRLALAQQRARPRGTGRK